MQNLGPSAILRWMQEGQSKELKIAAVTIINHVVSILAATQPEAIQFQVFDFLTGNPVKVNGKDFVSILPMLEGKTTQIMIGPGKLYF